MISLNLWLRLPLSQVFLRSGQFAAYEVSPSPSLADHPAPSTRASTLLVKFVKVASRAFDIQQPSEDGERTVLAEQKRISRLFIPFVSSPVPGTIFSGVFLTGDRPCWILSTDKGGIRILPSGHSLVHAFTACSLWESKGDFLLYSEEVRDPPRTKREAGALWLETDINHDASGAHVSGMDPRCPARAPPTFTNHLESKTVLERRL